MNNTNALSLFHVRSSRAVISSGYRLFMGNFKTLFRLTWPFALVYALVMALMMNTLLRNIPQMLSAAATMQQGGALPDGMTDPRLLSQLFILVGMLVSILLCAPVFKALAEHQDTNAMTPPGKWYGATAWPMSLRLLRLALWFWLLYVVVVFVLFLVLVGGGAALIGLTGGHPSKTLIVGIACPIVLGVLALILPMVYTGYKYLLTPGTRFVRVLTSTYGVGLRHWGSLFLVSLMVAIITTLLSFIIMQPYNILTAAMIRAQMGVAGGDPVGMPDYMGWMSFVVFCISGFIMAYLHLSTLFPFYYLYGSVEQEEKEREQLKTKPTD